MLREAKKRILSVILRICGTAQLKQNSIQFYKREYVSKTNHTIICSLDYKFLISI
jgi:hypothetical protein